jgi:hypothetical protein
MKLFNLRTNILLFLVICATGYFAFWYFSQPKTESAFVVKVLKSSKYKLTDDEITQFGKDFCVDSNSPTFHRDTNFLFTAYWIKVFINNDEIRLDGYLNPQFRELSDIESIKVTLKSLFSFRDELGILKNCVVKSNKIVLIQASHSTKYGEVVKVIDALKEIGAEPIILQIDDLQK